MNRILRLNRMCRDRTGRRKNYMTRKMNEVYTIARRFEMARFVWKLYTAMESNDVLKSNASKSRISNAVFLTIERNDLLLQAAIIKLHEIDR